MWTELSMLITRLPISLSVNVDLISIRLRPRQRFTLCVAFEQQGSCDLLLDCVVNGWIEIFRVLDPHNVNALHATSIIVKSFRPATLILLVSTMVYALDNDLN